MYVAVRLTLPMVASSLLFSSLFCAQFLWRRNICCHLRAYGFWKRLRGSHANADRVTNQIKEFPARSTKRSVGNGPRKMSLGVVDFAAWSPTYASGYVVVLYTEATNDPRPKQEPEDQEEETEEGNGETVVQVPTIDEVPYSQEERDQDSEDLKFMCPITMEFPRHVPPREDNSRSGVAFYVPHKDRENRDERGRPTVVLYVFSLEAIDNLMENREYDNRFTHPITRSQVHFEHLAPWNSRCWTTCESLVSFALQPCRFQHSWSGSNCPSLARNEWMCI